MGEVPLRAFERPQFQAFPHRVRAQIVWPSTSRCQSRPNAGKAAHDRVPPAEARIQGSAVQTARARLSLLPSVCYSRGPLRAGSTEGVAFLGIAVVGGPSTLFYMGPCTVCVCGETVHVLHLAIRGGPLTAVAESGAPRASARHLGLTLRIVYRVYRTVYGNSARVTTCKFIWHSKVRATAEEVSSHPL